MGRPVVAFDHGGATESIRHGETGWLAVPGDADSLAAALQAALDLTPRKRKTLAINARQYIEANFSTETMCRQTMKIYRRVLDRAEVNRGAKS
jgi:glycosyltransferase involved in cell wall biosynthesis